MTAIVENVKIIKNSDKIKIFELPQDTLLDNILNDLWSDIIKYQFPYCFTVCEYDVQPPKREGRKNSPNSEAQPPKREGRKNSPNSEAQYPGFRPITRNEFEQIKPIFLDFYEKNGGISNIFNIKQNSLNSYLAADDYMIICGKCIFSKNMILFDNMKDAHINPYGWISANHNGSEYLRLVVSDNFEKFDL
jgi:hypothetical protein